MIKTDLDMTNTFSSTIVPEMEIESPKKTNSLDYKNYSSPNEIMMKGARVYPSSPYKSHSFSSLRQLSSPSQISARKLLRKYNSNQYHLSGHRREISSLRRSLPPMTPASSELDLVLMAITYIQHLQQKLVSITDEVNTNNDEKLV